VSGLDRSALTKLCSGLAWSTGAELAAKATIALPALYLPRVLHAQALGKVVALQATASILWLLTDFVSNSAHATRLVARAHGGGNIEVGNVLIRRALGIGGCILLALPWIVWSSERVPAALAVLHVVVTGLSCDWWLRAKQRLQTLAFANMIGATASTLLLLLFVNDSDDVLPALIAWVSMPLCVTCTIAVALWNDINHAVAPDHVSPIRTAAAESATLAAAGALGTLMVALPIVALNLTQQAEDVGTFAAPYRLIVACFGVSHVFIQALYPTFLAAGSAKEVSALLSVVQRGIVATTVPLALLASWCAPMITLALIPGDAPETTAVLRNCLWLIPVQYLVAVDDVALIATGRDRQRLLCYAAGVSTVGVLVPPVAHLGNLWAVGAVVLGGFSIVLVGLTSFSHRLSGSGVTAHSGTHLAAAPR
jgi:O-antigen/teichoic acid export membrane protein